MVINVGHALSAYKQASTGGIQGVAGATATKSQDDTFSNMVEGFLSEAVGSIKKSEEMATKGAVGKADLQEVILAVSDAEIMMQTVTSIRDKVIAAYQEVIRTSI